MFPRTCVIADETWEVERRGRSARLCCPVVLIRDRCKVGMRLVLRRPKGRGEGGGPGRGYVHACPCACVVSTHVTFGVAPTHSPEPLPSVSWILFHSYSANSKWSGNVGVSRGLGEGHGKGGWGVGLGCRVRSPLAEGEWLWEPSVRGWFCESERGFE